MIREYRPEDLEPMLEVWDAANAVAHPFLSEEFVAQVRRDIPALYLPNAVTFIWERKARVAGFIALIGNEIGALFVDPSLHRSGIGAALTDHARTLHDSLEVEVFEQNRVGRAFYAKYGFVQMHQSTHEPTGAAVLRLKLPA